MLFTEEFSSVRSSECQWAMTRERQQQKPHIASVYSYFYTSSGVADPDGLLPQLK